jgi:hypothetical protein
MKKTIKLNEKQLQTIIKEAVENIVNDNNESCYVTLTTTGGGKLYVVDIKMREMSEKNVIFSDRKWNAKKFNKVTAQNIAMISRHWWSDLGEWDIEQ